MWRTTSKPFLTSFLSPARLGFFFFLLASPPFTCTFASKEAVSFEKASQEIRQFRGKMVSWLKWGDGAGQLDVNRSSSLLLPLCLSSEGNSLRLSAIENPSPGVAKRAKVPTV